MAALFPEAGSQVQQRRVLTHSPDAPGRQRARREEIIRPGSSLHSLSEPPSGCQAPQLLVQEADTHWGFHPGPQEPGTHCALFVATAVTAASLHETHQD